MLNTFHIRTEHKRKEERKKEKLTSAVVNTKVIAKQKLALALPAYNHKCHKRGENTVQQINIHVTMKLLRKSGRKEKVLLNDYILETVHFI